MKQKLDEMRSKWKFMVGMETKSELWLCACGWWDDLPGMKPHKCQRCGSEMEIQSKLQALNWLTILLNQEREKNSPTAKQYEFLSKENRRLEAIIEKLDERLSDANTQLAVAKERQDYWHSVCDSLRTADTHEQKLNHFIG